jgi:molybdate/tungstate transport system substrate-binding protein
VKRIDPATLLRSLLALACAGAALVAGCDCGSGGPHPSPADAGRPAGGPEPESTPVVLFHAAGLTPFVDRIRDRVRDELGIALRPEASGSQAACRKLTETGRQADLLMLADNRLVETLLAGHADWRIDFATDAVVLGVGVRAPDVAQAEADWPGVLLQPRVRIARVDETLGPIGYRTLLVWRLREQRLGPDGLHEALLEKSEPVVDHVSRLPPLLRTGQVHYAFLYRSLCTASDLRFIELDPRVNLSDPAVDYSGTSVTFDRLQAGAPESITLRGAPIVWTLTIPHKAGQREAATRLVRYLLASCRDELARTGFEPLEPARYYGPEDRHPALRTVAPRRGPQP